MALLVLWDLLVNKDLLVNQEQMGILAQLDLRANLDLMAHLAHLVRMDILVLLARFLVPLAQLGQLASPATTAPLEKTVFPALLVYLAKTENLALLHMPVKFTDHY